MYGVRTEAVPVFCYRDDGKREADARTYVEDHALLPQTRREGKIHAGCRNTRNALPNRLDLLCEGEEGDAVGHKSYTCKIASHDYIILSRWHGRTDNRCYCACCVPILIDFGLLASTAKEGVLCSPRMLILNIQLSGSLAQTHAKHKGVITLFGARDCVMI